MIVKSEGDLGKDLTNNTKFAASGSLCDRQEAGFG